MDKDLYLQHMFVLERKHLPPSCYFVTDSGQHFLICTELDSSDNSLYWWPCIVGLWDSSCKYAVTITIQNPIYKVHRISWTGLAQCINSKPEDIIHSGMCLGITRKTFLALSEYNTHDGQQEWLFTVSIEQLSESKNPISVEAVQDVILPSLKFISVLESQTCQNPNLKSKTESFAKSGNIEDEHKHNAISCQASQSQSGLNKSIQNSITGNGIVQINPWEKFCSLVTMDNEQELLRKALIHDLGQLLLTGFPQSRLYTFGSFETGLGDGESDLDLFVDGCTSSSPVVGDPARNRSIQQQCVNKVRQLLQKAFNLCTGEKVCKYVEAILASRVPIVRLVHAPTAIRCDLSFGGLGVRNSQLISFMMKLDPRVKPLILFVRYWGKYYYLTASTRIKNYALTLLVLHFLAIEKVIPRIVDLKDLVQQSSDDIVEVGEWDASFCSDKSAVLAFMGVQERSTFDTLEILQLAHKFFTFVGHADFDSHVACTLTAEFLPREMFYHSPDNFRALPSTLNRYKTWFDNNPKATINFPPEEALCIQDPFELIANVGAPASHLVLKNFQYICLKTADLLAPTLQENTKYEVCQLIGIFVPVDVPYELMLLHEFSLQRNKYFVPQMRRKFRTRVP